MKKINTSSLSKIIRGNVYVISNKQYDALQDGFKEEKNYVYKTEGTKDEIEVGKELTHQMKPYEEHATFSAEEYAQNQSLQIAGPILFVGFFIGIVFFVCAGSFLYFRLFSDLEDDTRLFEMIRKVRLNKWRIIESSYNSIGAFILCSNRCCNITWGSSVNCTRTDV